MSSGGGGQSTNTITNSNAYIPDWLSNAAQGAVSNAQSLAAQPYQAYTGQTVAAPTTQQQQAYQEASNLQGFGNDAMNQGISAYQNMLGAATPETAAANAANTGQMYGGYAQNVLNPANQMLGQYSGTGAANITGQGAQSLMSPYASSVIAPTMALGQQALAQNLQQIGANANQAGAFGGSRQGVMEGMAQAQAALNEQNTLGQMLNQGWNTNVQAAGQGTATGANAMGNLAGLYGTGYNAAQTQAGNIGAQNLTAGMSAANNLPQALQTYQGNQLSQMNALNAAGQAQQQYQQNILNAGYNTYAAQQAWPYQQLQTVLSAISGVPYSTTNTGTTSDQYYTNPWGTAIGGAAAAGGLLSSAGNLLSSGSGST